MSDDREKIILIGLGSMGKRRIRLLRSISKELLIYGVDKRQDRREEVKRAFGIETFENLEEALRKEEPTMAFVCAAPIAHYSIIKECLENGVHVFSEINLINENHKDLIKTAERQQRVLFLSSTPKYRKEMQFIKSSVNEHGAQLAYTYHVGQYLPDWHPWEKIEEFFVGDRRTNGCREIFAIELPWIIDVFGDITEYHVIKDKLSELKIDFPDTYQLCVKHSGGHIGTICFDVVSKPAVRSLQVVGEGFNIKWDGQPDSLFCGDNSSGTYKKVDLYQDIKRDNKYNSTIVENMYEDEIANFLDVVRGNAKPFHSFEKDIEVLQFIDEIEGI